MINCKLLILLLFFNDVIVGDFNRSLLMIQYDRLVTRLGTYSRISPREALL